MCEINIKPGDVILCTSRKDDGYMWLSILKDVGYAEEKVYIKSYADLMYIPLIEGKEIEYDMCRDDVGTIKLAEEQDIMYFKEKLREDGSQKAIDCLMIIDKVNQESVKNDRKDDKLRWDLLPLNLIEMVVKVFHFGAKKYGENRWQNLPDAYNRYKGAMLRHLVAHEKGEVLDPESGLPHLAHMAWNALAILFVEIVGKK